MSGELTLDALEQALWARDRSGALIHHSDRGSQYLAIRYTERLAEEGIEPSVGSVGDSYDNAMAESIIGLYKAEVVDHRDSLNLNEYTTILWKLQPPRLDSTEMISGEPGAVQCLPILGACSA